MEQKSNFAAAKDVRIKSDREERVGGMGLRSNANYAAGKNAQIWFKKEECVLGMGHRRRDAAVKDAQMEPNVEESVGGMVITVLTMDQLLSGRRSVH